MVCPECGILSGTKASTLMNGLGSLVKYGFDSAYGGFGYGSGFGNSFYCPPYAYTTGATGVSSRSSRNWDRYYVGRRETSTSSVRTNTGYGSKSRVSPSTTDRRQTARPAGYSSTRINKTQFKPEGLVVFYKPIAPAKLRVAMQDMVRRRALN